MSGQAGNGLVARGLVMILRGYQLTLSALIGRRCRYLPTCSEYAMEAINRHGVWHGMRLGAGRVCRCHPWGGDGFDPVPEERPKSRRYLTLGRKRS